MCLLSHKYSCLILANTTVCYSLRELVWINIIVFFCGGGRQHFVMRHNCYVFFFHFFLCSFSPKYAYNHSNVVSSSTSTSARFPSRHLPLYFQRSSVTACLDRSQSHFNPDIRLSFCRLIVASCTLTTTKCRDTHIRLQRFV